MVKVGQLLQNKLTAFKQNKINNFLKKDLINNPNYSTIKSGKTRLEPLADTDESDHYFSIVPQVIDKEENYWVGFFGLNFFLEIF